MKILGNRRIFIIIKYKFYLKRKIKGMGVKLGPELSNLEKHSFKRKDCQKSHALDMLGWTTNA